MKMTSAQYRATRPRTGKKAKTDYKSIFLAQLAEQGIPAPDQEVVFAAPRRWRLDFAWPVERIAVEYNGGNFSGDKGGHSSVAGLMRDYEKFTEAALRGWTLILIDARSVTLGRALAWTLRAFQRPVPDEIITPKRARSRRASV